MKSNYVGMGSDLEAIAGARTQLLAINSGMLYLLSFNGFSQGYTQGGGIFKKD